MELSVIILSYNVQHYVWQCIDSVLAAVEEIKAEVILVDNASSDETLVSIAKDFPRVKLIANADNIGFSRAYNQAVKQAKGTYLCILNPDTVVGESVFKTLLRSTMNQSNIGAIGTQFIDGRGCFLPECKRVVPTPLGSLRKLLGFAGQRDVYYHDSIAPDEEGPVSILAGAFLFLKRFEYVKIDGFDEHYFMFGEDIDFSYKLLLKGQQNYYLGTQKIIHYKGESTQKNRQYLERFYGAMVHFYKTHFSKSRFKVSLVSLVAQGLILWRGFWPKEQSAQVLSLKAVFWVSDSLEPSDALANWLRQKVNVLNLDSFNRVTPEGLKNTPPENALLVFDRASMSYDTIIELMSSGASYGQRFRIWHSQNQLLIGSDSSDAHGEALILR
ncbi:glycosyltransferase family 2 protein [Flavobacteriaceae bacterium]|nr:glycosyltransferase family 2 protein [Flavobacteriaceae bacterium]